MPGIPPLAGRVGEWAISTSPLVHSTCRARAIGAPGNGRCGTLRLNIAARRQLTTAIPPARRRSRRCIVVVLCLTWGFNQPAIKLAIPTCRRCCKRDPLGRSRRSSSRRDAAARPAAHWRATARCSPGSSPALLFGFEFLLIYRGLLYTTASRAVLFIYLAPFFVVLGARWFCPATASARCNGSACCCRSPAWWWRSACRRRRVDPRQLLGDLMMVAAALAWAATTLVIKASALARVSPEKTLLYQLVVCAPIVALGALAVRRADRRPCRRRWRSARSPTRPSWVVSVPSASGSR